jgi:hypothetical protein
MNYQKPLRERSDPPTSAIFSSAQRKKSMEMKKGDRPIANSRAQSDRKQSLAFTPKNWIMKKGVFFIIILKVKVDFGVPKSRY